jgi:hypothetical protein
MNFINYLCFFYFNLRDLVMGGLGRIFIEGGEEEMCTREPTPPPPIRPPIYSPILQKILHSVMS